MLFELARIGGGGGSSTAVPWLLLSLAVAGWLLFCRTAWNVQSFGDPLLEEQEQESESCQQ